MDNHGYKKAFIVSAIGIPAAIIATVVATYLTGGSGGTSSVGEQPPSASAAAPVVTPAATSPAQSEIVDPSPTPAPQPTKFSPITISLDDVISSQWCKQDYNTGFSWYSGTKTIAGKGYTDGFRCRVGYAPAVGYVDLSVPQGAEIFSVVAGQSDDASSVDNTIQFEVINAVNGEVLGDQSVPFGAAATFEVPVDGLIRLRLQVSADSSQPAQTWAAWADPTFR